MSAPPVCWLDAAAVLRGQQHDSASALQLQHFCRVQGTNVTERIPSASCHMRRVKAAALTITGHACE